VGGTGTYSKTVANQRPEGFSTAADPLLSGLPALLWSPAAAGTRQLAGTSQYKQGTTTMSFLHNATGNSWQPQHTVHVCWG
jgi:hypothetical protein